MAYKLGVEPSRKILTNPTIQGTVAAGTGLTLPAFIAGGNINLNNKLFTNGYEGLRSLLDKGRVLLPIDWPSWDAALVGSGARSNRNLNVNISTGATANSSSVLSTVTYGLNAASANRERVNWDKKLLIALVLTRATSEAETTAYFHLKEANSHGDLAAKGIGVVISNLTLRGEGYGTARGTTTATQVMTTHRPYLIGIIFDPATPSCSWYINGTLLETITTAASLPTGAAGADNYLVLSIKNGATGGTSAEFELGLPLIWQGA